MADKEMPDELFMAKNCWHEIIPWPKKSSDATKYIKADPTKVMMSVEDLKYLRRAIEHLLIGHSSENKEYILSRLPDVEEGK